MSTIAAEQSRPTRQRVVVKLSAWPDFLNVAYSIATMRAIHAIAAAF
jgi:hypothetical protein